MCTTYSKRLNIKRHFFLNDVTVPTRHVIKLHSDITVSKTINTSNNYIVRTCWICDVSIYHTNHMSAGLTNKNTPEQFVYVTLLNQSGDRMSSLERTVLRRWVTLSLNR